MKKIVITAFLILLTVINCGAFGKPKKIKCKKPIYFFENVQKDVLFNYLDEIVQKEEYDVKKMYPDLGLISVRYQIKKKQTSLVNLLLKQFGNDVYLFIDIPKNNTELEHYVYKGLKEHAKNSYLINNDLLCRQLTDDADSIRIKRKPIIQETQYNPAVYVMDMKRYVGYDKKKYRRNPFKRKDKARAKQEAKQIEKEEKIKAKIQKRESKKQPLQL